VGARPCASAWKACIGNSSGEEQEVAEPPIPRSSVELGIVCQEFVELVTEHLEGTLPEAVERVVAEHLDLCDP
jgi:hypothetical protein